MLPVIAIVGRPNVGKSTLFNYLTASRNALVSDLPGMTRDRQYGEADIDNHRFILVDTGGLLDDKDDINVLTKEQSMQAIDDADKILFVVDGRSGLTPADLNIAKNLRKQDKPVFLVVNKAEDLDLNISMAEFYKLGLGEPTPISASHKRGIADLIQAVFKNEAESPVEDEKQHPGIKLAFVGRPNVGKSTLTNRILGEERVVVSDTPGTTRDSIFVPLKRDDQDYTLIDTAGIRRRGKVFETTEKFSVVKTLQATEASNVVLFMMDAKEGVTDQDLKLLGFILQTGRALVIAMNKWDGLTEDERTRAKTSIDRKLKFAPFARVHYISAMHGSGVGNLFASITEAYESATKEFSTPELNSILTEAVAAHNPPMVQGRRIKLKFAHSGGQNPPVVVIHGNQVKSLPESYKKYLANTFQKKLNLIGTPLQIQLRSGDNPFKDVKNVLTDRQRRKKKRLMKKVKK